jgi:hypothetical protein
LTGACQLNNKILELGGKNARARIVGLTLLLFSFGGGIAGLGLHDADAAQQNQDGLVNVAIGDITIQDINVGVAAGVAANVCNVKVGPIALLARQVDATGVSQTVCTSNSGPVVLSQN